MHDSLINKKLNFNSISAGAFNSSVVSNTYLSNNTVNSVSKQTPEGNEDSISKVKNLVLQAVIQLGEFYNVDKTSESAYKIYIKKIEIEDGIWEQIYAYFNMGVWYMKKTYYDKSVKSFNYCLELLDNHKKGATESVIFRADCLYNIAQGHYLLGETAHAIETMQECYRVRVNGIGKNSMECSYCLYSLAIWYRDLQRWSECLQYL